MYLEKLQAQGFKSFAQKYELVFKGMVDKERRGLTSIVGPNGSGKSNVADAVRWALGEQSMKTLRGKKAEDIIFSGSDKKGKLGMAEVSLFLNNEEKSKKIEAGAKNISNENDRKIYSFLEHSQIVITRRLYRNGDSEYMVNNNRVRLSDIQMLLAKASFGQKTYSVIGQGMVEGFLNTSLAERKEFFDEATGVKQFQMKRDESLNKLKNSYENLNQAHMLLNEIEPRLKSLTRQVNKLKKRDELENELKIMQLDYYRTIWHDIDGNFKKYNSQYLEIDKNRKNKEHKLSHLNMELEKMKLESVENDDYNELQNALNINQNKKDEITNKIARISAQLETKLEAHGKFDLSFLLNKKEELEKERKQIGEEVQMLKQSIEADNTRKEELNKEKEVADKKIGEINKKMKMINIEIQNIKRENEETKAVNKKIANIINKIKEAENKGDLEEIKKYLRNIEEELKDLLIQIEGDNNLEKEEKEEENEKWKIINEKLEEASRIKENIIIKINENQVRISARSERVRLLEEKRNSIQNELKEIDSKLDQRSDDFDFGGLEKEKNLFKKELESLDEEIENIRGKVAIINKKEEEKRNKLFDLQREIQNLQNEVNTINNELNNIKIKSTRFETKLEDLEIEIRDELGGMKEVSEGEMVPDYEVNLGKEKITQIKRQLEQIGGIDPSVEGEYNETKERFDFLDGQVKDFASTVESLEKIIKELDTIIKERFDKEFKIIAQKFEEYFKILFNGGAAKIIKVIDEEKPEAKESDVEGKVDKKANESFMDVKKIKFLQKHNATGLAGIEIQATPPGKKITTVSILSGGERALTAIALICAIISANPSPFVVLDEVDAALDEANSERLAKILDDLSNKTQFIAITHNRAIMRKANILYGVTMGDDGVSKLLSVKLDQVSEITNS